MDRSLVFILRLLVVLGLLLQAGRIQADAITARVIGVSDGDTITALDAQRQQHKIRLAGIDAPEKTQPFGQASKKHLSDLVFNRDVILDCGKTDRYRRKICVVMIDGRDANLAQVKAGMAWWYRRYQREQVAQQRVDYEAAEAAAKAGKQGLWQDVGALPPWAWRHK
jgi:endonuclease YncB( thermonuclease family)